MDEPDHSPIELDDIERRGAKRFGASIARVLLIHADGRRVSVDLPQPDDRARQGPDLSTTQRKILDIADKSPRPLTRKVFAMKCGRADAKGKFGREIRELVDLGLLIERGGELADTLEKFNESE